MTDNCTVVAFIEQDTGFHPGHIRDIKQGNVYYLVIDGVRGQIHEALEDAAPDAKSSCGWKIAGRVYE